MPKKEKNNNGQVMQMREPRQEVQTGVHNERHRRDSIVLNRRPGILQAGGEGNDDIFMPVRANTARLINVPMDHLPDIPADQIQAPQIQEQQAPVQQNQVQQNRQARPFLKQNTVLNKCRNFTEAQNGDKKDITGIRSELNAYFQERDSVGQAEGLDDIRKAEALRLLTFKARRLRSLCLDYRKHNHPYFKKGQERLQSVKEVQWSIENELDRLQIALQKFDAAYESPEAGKYKIEGGRLVKVKDGEVLDAEAEKDTWEVLDHTLNGDREAELDKEDRGFKTLKLTQKADTLTGSDKKRLDEKKYYSNEVKEDLLRDGLSRDVKDVLKLISEYADIHTTASHLTSTAFLRPEDRRNKKYKEYSRKLNRQRDKLSMEKSRVIEIIDKLNRLSKVNSSNRTMILKYLGRFTAMAGGGLKVEPGADILDFSHKRLVRSYDENKGSTGKLPKLAKKSLEVKDRENEPLFSHEPCAQDVVQQNFGDCFFLSTVAELASKDGNLIRGMMKDEGKTVVVRFFHKDDLGAFTPVYVRVSKNVPKDAGALDTLWVKLMETAYAAFLQQYPDENSYKGDRELWKKESAKGNWVKDDELDYVHIANGGLPGQALEHLTGLKRSDDITISDSVLTGRSDDTFEMMKRIAALTPDDQSVTVDEKEKIVSFKEVTDKMAEAGKDFENIYTEKKASAKKQFEDNDKKYSQVVNKREEGLDNKKNNDEIFKRLRKEYEDATKDYEAALNTENEEAAEDKYNKAQKKYMDYSMNMEEEYNKAFEEEVKKYAKLKKASVYELMENIDRKKNHPGDEDIIKAREAALNTVSREVMQDILLKTFNRRMFRKGNAAKEDYEAVIRALDSFTYEEYINNGRYNERSNLEKLQEYMFVVSGDKAMEIVRLHIKLLLKKITDNFDRVADPEDTTPFSGNYTEEAKQIFERIRKGKIDKRDMMAGTKELQGKESAGHAGEKTDGGIGGKHAYSILDAQIISVNGRPVRFIKLRNPWGVSVPLYRYNERTRKFESFENLTKTNGVFLCELNHFVKAFSDIYGLGA